MSWIMLKSCGVILVILEESSCRFDFSFLYFLLPLKKHYAGIS